MKITANIEKLPSGKYCAMVDSPNGPTCGDGLSVEGVCRVVALSIVDALGEMVDLGELDNWISE